MIFENEHTHQKKKVGYWEFHVLGDKNVVKQPGNLGDRYSVARSLPELRCKPRASFRILISVDYDDQCHRREWSITFLKMHENQRPGTRNTRTDIKLFFFNFLSSKRILFNRRSFPHNGFV